MTDYEVLIAYGHSAKYALDISLDAKRGVKYAIEWLATVREVLSIK